MIQFFIPILITTLFKYFLTQLIIGPALDSLATNDYSGIDLKIRAKREENLNRPLAPDYKHK